MRVTAMYLAFAALTGSGCLRDIKFICFSDDQCDGEAGGTCEPVGYCSFPDFACAPPSRRYGSLAGKDYAGKCVGEHYIPPDAGIDAAVPIDSPIAAWCP